MGVEDKIIIHPYKHPPWPEATEDYEFTSGFIDGTHTAAAAKKDFEGMRERVTKYIIFHDVDKGRIRRVFEAAMEEWEIEYIKGRMGVLKRVR